MIRIGLTGGIGSGKSVVAQILKVLGVAVFNSDHAARAMMEHDRELQQEIIDRFGEQIYPEGKLDRSSLASIVFNDPAALKDLNSIVHPAVRAKFNSWAGAQNSPYSVMESAILAETGGHELFDQVIVVSAPEQLRITRVMQRDGVEEHSVHARMRNQSTEEERLAIADHVIKNDHTQLVIPQVLSIHEQLLKWIGNGSEK
ncbi:MAG: dephospho-CoA kinase [Bacteroidota bacterium]|nr:dephospho-CoA kinase [Bacteroidota bacterium]